VRKRETVPFSNRAGEFILQADGYSAFAPKSLPPSPPIQYDSSLLDLLSRATLAVGRLDGAGDILPDPDLFVSMYVRKEAVLSSQIENTQASLVDVLEYESRARTRSLPEDTGEVVNYVRAMNYGLDRLKALPLSLRLIREIHAELLKGARGHDRAPGEFRKQPNWIGPQGTGIQEAVFVPPPVPVMEKALHDLESYFHSETPTPVLINVGLVHAQFETIHPFLDGNGRVGRLLVTFLLCQQKVLCRPLLYLSHFFAQRKQEYYDRLMGVRLRGDWEGWLRFFLEGVATVGLEATEKARKIIDLREAHRKMIALGGTGRGNYLRLLDRLYRYPVVSAKDVEESLEVSPPTANSLVQRFTELGLLREITGRQRDRIYHYQEYINLLVD
jgi:Fic family protein